MPESTGTRVTTPFTAESTAEEVIEGRDLTGRRAVVTGAASGIGVETARALAGAGAEVTLAVRNAEAGARTARDITGTTGNPQVLVAPLDLADQESVAAFTAGVGRPAAHPGQQRGRDDDARLRTPQGWELQFATNHLGHFALATGLHAALAAGGAAAAPGWRASARSATCARPWTSTTSTSGSGRTTPRPRTASPRRRTSLFAVEAHRRWAADGITVNAVHPGAILDTNLTRHMDEEALKRAVEHGGYTFKTPQQGAATSVLLATWPALEGVGGRYFEDGNEAAAAHARR